MEHLDAKAIRERLNSISLAIATLDQCSPSAHHTEIAHAARRALAEIAVLVTDDEMEEHGATPNGDLRQRRRAIREEQEKSREKSNEAGAAPGTPDGMTAAS